MHGQLRPGTDHSLLFRGVAEYAGGGRRQGRFENKLGHPGAVGSLAVANMDAVPPEGVVCLFVALHPVDKPSSQHVDAGGRVENQADGWILALQARNLSKGHHAGRVGRQPGLLLVVVGVVIAKLTGADRGWRLAGKRNMAHRFVGEVLRPLGSDRFDRPGHGWQCQGRATFRRDFDGDRPRIGQCREIDRERPLRREIHCQHLRLASLGRDFDLGGSDRAARREVKVGQCRRGNQGIRDDAD